MKKILVFICLFVMGFSVVAQENTESSENPTKCKKEKKEKLLLPEKGDWAIGADMVPLLRTLGTVFWGADEPIGFQGTPNSLIGGYYPNVSIMGKYMICKNWAIRANLGVGAWSFTQVSDSIRNDAAFFDDEESLEKVVDKSTNKYGNISLALGAEYRLGKKRVQGIFGADLLLGYYGASKKYGYGNEMTEENPIPTTFWDTYISKPIGISRVLSQKSEGAFAIGLQASVGVEVFVAPKIALGGQVNLSYVFLRETKGSVVYEGYNEDSDAVLKRKDILRQPYWQHSFSTNNLGASLYMSFYF